MRNMSEHVQRTQAFIEEMEEAAFREELTGKDLSKVAALLTVFGHDLNRLEYTIKRDKLRFKVANGREPETKEEMDLFRHGQLDKKQDEILAEAGASIQEFEQRALRQISQSFLSRG